MYQQKGNEVLPRQDAIIKAVTQMTGVIFLVKLTFYREMLWSRNDRQYLAILNAISPNSFGRSCFYLEDEASTHIIIETNSKAMFSIIEPTLCSRSLDIKIHCYLRKTYGEGQCT